MMKYKAYMNWSGGKDAALAYYTAQQQYAIDCLFTSVNAVHNRISMHGVRRELLEAQANSIGLPLVTLELPEQPDMNEYEVQLQQHMKQLNGEGYTHSIFGDIFLEDLRQYRENQLLAAGCTGVFPLWKKDSKALLKEFWALGFTTIIVCVNERYLDKRFCGRILDEQCVMEMPAGVDVCGENGEFHTFVYEGPVFKQPISFTKGDVVYREYAAPGTNSKGANAKYGFWFCDLLPA